MTDWVTQAQFEALETKVDAGFAGVDVAFAEQRAYTEHAFEVHSTQFRSRDPRQLDELRFEFINRV